MSSKFKKQRQEIQIKDGIVPIPQILGANFDFDSCKDISYYQKMIDDAPKPKEPIRVLIDSEAAYLHTGFSVYARNLIDYLNKNPNLIIAHHASYGAPAQFDPRAADLAKKCIYYHNLPSNYTEEQEFCKKNTNQFGEWKASYVYTDFKPDIVLCVPKNTLVVTENGYKPIQDIKIGENVLTHKNRFKKVTQTINRVANKIVRIKALEITDPIEATPEHPFYIIKKEDNIKPRELYCPECKIYSISDIAFPTCHQCGTNLITVTFSLIDGKRITGNDEIK